MIIYYTHGFSGAKGESHELLKKAIAEYKGDELLAGRLVASLKRQGQFGKPVIDGFDCFSISHSNNTWAVLFAGAECGLDIQYSRKCNEEQIARRFYSPEEAMRTDEFFRIWARREALVKAFGGSVAETDLPPVLQDEVACDGRIWDLFDVNIPDAKDLSAAVCIQRNDQTGTSPEQAADKSGEIEIREL